MTSIHDADALALERIVGSALIAIVRGDFSTDRLLRIAETLHTCGIDALEVTLNSEDALNHIEMLRSVLPASVLIGAGTVRTPRLLELAYQAGAQFALSPSFDPATVAAASRLDLLLIPGVLTPTEIDAASRLGCTAVKLFPADTFGPEYLRSLRAVFGDMTFIPTGGITSSNIGAYRRSGAAAVGVGSALVSSHPNGNDDLFQRATSMRLAWDEAV